LASPPTADPTADWLETHPDYRERLQRIVALEQQHRSPWRWDDVRVHPTALMKLVVAGVINVVPRRSDRHAAHTYALVDLDATRRALDHEE
jgi:hypothetical protein